MQKALLKTGKSPRAQAGANAGATAGAKSGAKRAVAPGAAVSAALRTLQIEGAGLDQLAASLKVTELVG